MNLHEIQIKFGILYIYIYIIYLLVINDITASYQCIYIFCENSYQKSY